MTGTANSLDSILGKDWQHQVDRRREEITSRIAARTDVVLFGSGYLGRHVRRDLDGLPYNAVAYVDNNPSLWGTQIDSLPVLGPDEAKARFGQEVLWLITIYTNAQVIEQCAALGVAWITCAELSWVLPEPHPPSFIFGAPKQLASFSSEIEEVASIWADTESAEEFRSQVRWRFLLDYEALQVPESMAELYFPSDLIRPRPDEIFVDCGAFTGDTVDAFLAARGGQFNQIVAVEPDPLNCSVLTSRIREWAGPSPERVHIAPVAVGARRGRLQFDVTGTAGSSVGAGTETVEVAPLDEILAGRKPTYIKFDVEGAEHDALVGGTGTISANMPVLAVCLYHRPEDLWDLPLLVRSIGPNYRLYVRRHSDERWETVLYAVPPDRALT